MTEATYRIACGRVCFRKIGVVGIPGKSTEVTLYEPLFLMPKKSETTVPPPATFSRIHILSDAEFDATASEASSPLPSEVPRLKLIAKDTKKDLLIKNMSKDGFTSPSAASLTSRSIAAGNMLTRQLKG